MKPLRSKKYLRGMLLNPATPYVPASRTDVRATMERVKRELDLAKASADNVAPIKREKRS